MTTTTESTTPYTTTTTTTSKPTTTTKKIKPISSTTVDSVTGRANTANALSALLATDGLQATTVADPKVCNIKTAVMASCIGCG